MLQAAVIAFAVLFNFAILDKFWELTCMYVEKHCAMEKWAYNIFYYSNDKNNINCE
jgi:hypothetical protein